MMMMMMMMMKKKKKSFVAMTTDCNPLLGKVKD
jgi:hypothetical protein